MGTPILSAEIRHLGGAVARRSSHHGAIGHVGGAVHHLRTRNGPDARLGAVVHGAVGQLMAALEPWEAEHT